MSDRGRKIWEFVKAQGAILAHLFLYDPWLEKILKMFGRMSWRKRAAVIGGVLASGLIIFLVLPGIAEAGLGAKILSEILNPVAASLAELLSLIGEAFNKVITGEIFNTIIGQPAVEIGWKATRDVANLAFVLILLGIGFATILRVPTYHIKKLIVPFIVALLLINFSKLICGVVTDFCRVIMLSFNAAIIGDNYSGSIAGSLGLSEWLHPAPDQTWESSYVQGLIILIIFIVALSFALLLLVLLMISRWISLIVLTIFSPLVYAAQILPTTKSFAKKWWQQFLQNAFYGPVAVFMVYLALQIVATSVGDLRQGVGGGPTGTGQQMMTWQTVVALIVACIILYKAVTMSRSMGIAGASAVINTGTKWGKKAGGAALGAALGGLGTVTGIKPAYQAISQRASAAWQARQKAQKEKRQESGVRMGLAVKTGMDRVRGRIPILRHETELQRRARAQQEQARTGREKKVAEDMQAGEKSEEYLDDKLKNGSKEEKLAAATEKAKRGTLDRTEYKKLTNHSGLSATGKAAMTDAMVASDPLADIEPTLLAMPGSATGAAEIKKLQTRLKKADLKKISTEALTTHPDSSRLVNAIAETRGKDGLTSIHKEMTSEADKTAFKDKIRDMSKVTGTGDAYQNIGAAHLAINKELAQGMNAPQLQEVIKKADMQDLGIAIAKGGLDIGPANPGMTTFKQEAIMRQVTPGKLKEVVNNAGSKGDDAVRIAKLAQGWDPVAMPTVTAVRAAPINPPTFSSQNKAALASMMTDPVLREMGKI